MRLAEALIQRADLKQRLAQLDTRITRNAKVQEGDAPAEDPNVLLAEFEQVAADYQSLIQRINATNLASRLAGGESLTEALARRDVLAIRMALYRKLAASATVTQDRSLKTEIKFRSTVSVAEVQRTADQLSKEHRQLDAEIQAANWSTDLLD